MPRLIAGLLAGSALVVLLSACDEKGVKMTAAGKAQGEILTVDNSGDVGYHVDMILDENDRPHIVYFDKKNKALKYVRHSAAGFSSEVVDSTCKRCLYATIRVTGDSEPHIAYFNDSTQTLTYAFRRDGKWKQEGIRWGKGSGMGVRLMFDDHQGLHALYYTGDGYLEHAWRVPNQAALETKKKAKTKTGQKGEKKKDEQPEGIWGNERVDKANGSENVSISLVRQPNGMFAASYFHWSGLSSEVRIAKQGEDGSWTTELVAFEHSPGKSSALIFNRQGEPIVFFREAMKDRLSIAELTAEGWKVTPLVPDAYSMSVAIGGTFNLLLGYESGRDPRKGHLRMAWRKDWQWYDYEVDLTRGSGSYLAAGLTTNGVPVLAYFEETGKSLKLFIGK
jgi:hypothetical protein